MDAMTDIKVDVAVLQEQYATIQQQLADGREFMGKIDSKFDRVLDQMATAATDRAVAAERAKIHNRLWTAARHIGTVVVAVVIAKLMKEPFSIGL
jgi:hypothetical protein